MLQREGNWCWRCGAGEAEPSREGCENPAWHVPDPKVYGEQGEEKAAAKKRE